MGNCFSSATEKPVVKKKMGSELPDLEELVKAWAWQMFDMTKSREQAKIPRDCMQMHINWKKVRFQHSEPEYMDPEKPPAPRSKILFKTFFTNNTGQDQEYSFKTERITKSTADIFVEKGVTIGQELSMSLKTPCEVFEANAGFSRELSVINGAGETIEEEMVWAVDSQIKVPAHTKTTAELVISEDQYGGKFQMKTKFAGKVMVTMTNIKDNNSFVKAIEGNIVDIMRREIENGLKDFVVERNHVSFITRGTCQFRFAIEQHVKLGQQALPAP